MNKDVQILTKNCLDLSKLVFRQSIMAFLDFMKTFYGQNFSRTMKNIIFYFFFLFTISLKNNYYFENPNNAHKFRIKLNFKEDFLFLLVLIINFMELVCWFFMKTGFNAQAFNAIDIEKIVTQFKDFYPYFIIATIFIFLTIILPFYQKVIRIPNVINLIIIIQFIFMFMFIISILNDFHSISNISLFDQSSDIFYLYLKQSLIDKFEMEPKVISASNKKKNLFLIQLESYPNEFVQNPQISPNLNRYSKQFEFISPWSLTATSVTQTGIPQIFPDFGGTLATKNDYEYITGIKGISQILGSINYNLEYATTGEASIMGFDEWVKAHGYTRVFTGINDLYLYDYIII